MFSTSCINDFDRLLMSKFTLINALTDKCIIDIRNRHNAC